ncbi:MAG: Zinc ion binding [Marteilia pararefringens]
MSAFAAAAAATTVECLEPTASAAAASSSLPENINNCCCITDYVTVPSAEHVSEIVGRRGYKIKSLRARTNTYIKTPNRCSQPVFVISGTVWDVESAKSHIIRDSLHFSAIKQKRYESDPVLAPISFNDDSSSYSSTTTTTTSGVQIVSNNGQQQNNGQESSSSDQMWPQVASAEGPKSFIQSSPGKIDSEVDIGKFACCATTTAAAAPKLLVHNNAAAAVNQKGYNLHELVVDNNNRDQRLMNTTESANSTPQFGACCSDEKKNEAPIHTTCPNNNVLYSSCHLRVPYNIVGLLVGPKGVTIKEIQSLSGCYIITPNRNRDPIFEIFGFPSNIKLVLGLIHSFLDMNLSVAERDSIRHIEVLSNYPLISSDLFQRSSGELQLAAARPIGANNNRNQSSLSLNDLALHGHLRGNYRNDMEQSGAAIGANYLQRKPQLETERQILQHINLGRPEETKKHRERSSLNLDSFPSHCCDDFEDYEDDEDHFLVNSLRSMIQSIGIFEEKG